jgi:serine/threonine protein kinase
MSLEGKQLGRYRLLNLIGSGNMGEVYRAEDFQLHRQVAIKVTRAEAASYPDTQTLQEAARLFQREARAIAMLDHPHILPLFDYGEENVNGAPLTYMVMPLRQEGSLTTWLQQYSGPGLLSSQDVVYFIHQAAEALQHAHDHQITHQDVKPSNFLIHSNREDPQHPDLLLADFGVAKCTNTTIGTSQTIRGTPAYMAPEQWEGHPVPATDQYGLAVMTYELLTGRVPFQGSMQQVMYQHFQVQPRPPSQLNPNLPPQIDEVLLRALAKRPESRFASIAAFARALQIALLDDSPNNAPTFIKTPSPPLMLQAQGTPYRPSPRAPTVNQSSFPPLAATHVRSSRNFPSGAVVLIALILFLLMGSAGVIYYVRAHNPPPVIPPTITPSAPTPTTSGALTPQPDSLYAQATSGSPIIDDSLSGQTTNNWYVDARSSWWSCQFADGAYHASVSRPGYIPSCMAQSSNFHNFAFEVQMTFITGDAGGINFRSSSDIQTFYRFYLYSDGSYELYVVYPGNQGHLAHGHVAINVNQPNILSAIVRNNDIYLYINKRQVAHVSDDKLSSGEIGVFCTDVTNPTEVAFSNAKVWVL